MMLVKFGVMQRRFFISTRCNAIYILLFVILDGYLFHRPNEGCWREPTCTSVCLGQQEKLKKLCYVFSDKMYV